MKIPVLPPDSPPAAVGAYVHALVGDVFGTSTATGPIRLAVQALELAPPERDAVRAASDLPDRFPETEDEPEDAGQYADPARVVVGLGLAAWLLHLRAFWAPMIHLGRRGEFRAHLPELRRGIERAQAWTAVVRVGAHPACDLVARRLDALKAELEGAMPEEGAGVSGLVAQPIYAAQDRTAEPAPPPRPIVDEEEPPARKPVRGRVWALLALALVAGAGSGSYLWMQQGRAFPAEHYRDIGPVLEIVRDPPRATVRFSALLDEQSPVKQRETLIQMVGALNKEGKGFEVMEFRVDRRLVATWKVKDMFAPGAKDMGLTFEKR